MADLADIRAGIAEALSDVEGIGQASPYMLSSPSPPCAHVFPADVNYDEAMHSGHDEWVLTVQALSSLTSDVGAQQLLDEWIAPSGVASIKQALETDETLGGAAFTTVVESCTGYREYTVADGRVVLGAEWRVVVTAAG